MPLGANAMELNRTNCVSLMLDAFQSNAVVKALIFMPGATDELYFFRRAHAKLTNANPIIAGRGDSADQSNLYSSHVPAAFAVAAHNRRSDERHRGHKKQIHGDKIADADPFLTGLRFDDAGWDDVRAVLGKKLSVGLRPFSDTPDSWHFYRHNFAACGVTEWGMLEAIALTDKTTFTVHWWTVDFQIDRRSGAVPAIENLRIP